MNVRRLLCSPLLATLAGACVSSENPLDKSEPMSAAPSARPLAPAIYLQPRLLNERFYWWYRVLVAKISRLCTGTLARAGTRGRIGHEVGPVLLQWEEAYKALFSKSWLAWLELEQLKAIYSELHTLAELVFAINAKRQEGDTCASAISTTVCCPPPLLSSYDMCQVSY